MSRRQAHARTELMKHYFTGPETASNADQTRNWVIGSPGQWVIWVIFHVRVMHRVIILTRCETRVFPVFETKAQD